MSMNVTSDYAQGLPQWQSGLKHCKATHLCILSLPMVLGVDEA